jgi:O-antigen/teichoic acid export membrane protein
MTAPDSPSSGREAPGAGRPASLRNDVGTLVGARIAVAALGWAGTLLIVRHLGGTSWGEFSLVFNLLGLLLIFTSAVGTRSAVRGFVDDPDPEGFLGSYIILRFVLGVVGYVAVVTFVLAAGYPATVVRASELGAVMVVFGSVSNGYELLFAVRQRMYRIAIAQLAGQVAQFALTVALVVVGTDVVGFTVPAIVCEVVILVVVLGSARRIIHIRYRVDRSSWGELIRTAIPFALCQAFFTLYYSVDTVILSKLQGFDAVGIYSIAYKFAGVVTMIPLAVSLGVTGRLVQAWPDEPTVFWRTIRQATLALFIGGAAVVVEFSIIARPAIITLYGHRYAVGATAAALVVGGACLAFFTSLAITALAAQGRNRWYPITGAIGLAVNVGLNLWLIPEHSYLAAAWVTVITEVVVLVVLLPSLLRGHWADALDARPMLITAGVAIAIAIIGSALSQVTSWEVTAVLTTVGFFAAIHVIGVPGPRGLLSLLDGDVDASTLGATAPSSDQPARAIETPVTANGSVTHDGAVTSGSSVSSTGRRGTNGSALRRRAAPLGRRRMLLHGPPIRRRADRGWGVLAVLVVLLAVVTTYEGKSLYLIGAALIVPAVVLVARRPQRGILLLAALVPFDGMLILVSSSGIVKSWKEALVVGILLATLVCPKSARASGPRPKVTWAVPLALLIAYSALTVPFFGIHADLTGFRIEYFYVLVPVAIWRCPLSRRDVDRLVTILMIDGAITAVYGLVQEALGGARLNKLGYPYNSVIRFSGSHLRAFSSFSQPFPFAYFLMMVILIGLAVSLPTMARARSKLFVASLPLLGVAMLFAFVRGALLGLGVGLAYLAIRRYPRMLLLVPILVLGVIYLPSSLSGSVFQSHSLDERTSGWSQNITQVVDHPLGQGLASSGAAAEAVATPAATTAATTNFISEAVPYQPDNEYFNQAYELGLPGLWLFVMFVLHTVGGTDRLARVRARAPSFPLGVTAFLLAALAAALVSSFFEIFPLNLYFYLLLGVVASRRWSEPRPVEAMATVERPFPEIPVLVGR